VVPPPLLTARIYKDVEREEEGEEIIPERGGGGKEGAAIEILQLSRLNVITIFSYLWGKRREGESKREGEGGGGFFYITLVNGPKIARLRRKRGKVLLREEGEGGGGKS